MKTISRFKGEYEFLHNYYPHVVLYEGIQYPTNEHAFQAAKTLDINLRKQIAACETPGKAKALGNVIPLRPDWEDVKTDVMKDLCFIKFSDPALRQLLLSTSGCYLIEGNHWGDTCWGMVNGKGENRLGRILMSLRDDRFKKPMLLERKESLDSIIKNSESRSSSQRNQRLSINEPDR